MIIAHRGGSGWRPENTLAAFEHAIRLGSGGIELDTHLTADGQVVVYHDAALNKATAMRADGRQLKPNKKYRLKDLGHHTLRKFQVGLRDPTSDYAKKFPDMTAVDGEKIPSLRQVVGLLNREAPPDFLLLVELKSKISMAGSARWLELSETIGHVMGNLRRDLRVAFCSFDWSAARHAKTLVKDAEAWFLTNRADNLKYAKAVRKAHENGGSDWVPDVMDGKLSPDTARKIADHGGDVWFMHHRQCDATTVASAHEAGIRAAAWSVNLCDKAEEKRVLACGIDAFCTDYP